MGFPIIIVSTLRNLHFRAPETSEISTFSFILPKCWKICQFFMDEKKKVISLVDSIKSNYQTHNSKLPNLHREGKKKEISQKSEISDKK